MPLICGQMQVLSLTQKQEFYMETDQIIDTMTACVNWARCLTPPPSPPAAPLSTSHDAGMGVKSVSDP